MIQYEPVPKIPDVSITELPLIASRLALNAAAIRHEQNSSAGQVAVFDKIIEQEGGYDTNLWSSRAVTQGIQAAADARRAHDRAEELRADDIALNTSAVTLSLGLLSCHGGSLIEARALDMDGEPIIGMNHKEASPGVYYTSGQRVLEATGRLGQYPHEVLHDYPSWSLYLFGRQGRFVKHQLQFVVPLLRDDLTPAVELREIDADKR